MIRIYHPAYSQFLCLADKCPDNCCEQYRILLFRWEQSLFGSKPEWQNLDGKGTPMRDYVHFSDGGCFLNKTPEGRCPFYGDDRLCGLQKRFGIGAMPSVCRTYPRLITSLPGRVEYALDTCCPQALALMEDWHPGELVISEGDEPSDRQYMIRKQAMSLFSDESQTVFQAIRETARLYGILRDVPEIPLSPDWSSFLRRAIAATIWAYAIPFSDHHLHPDPMAAIIRFLEEYISGLSDSANGTWKDMSSDFARAFSSFVKRIGFDDEVEEHYTDLLDEEL